MITLATPLAIPVQVPSTETATIARLRNITIRVQADNSVQLDVDWVVGANDVNGTFQPMQPHLDTIAGPAVRAAFNQLVTPGLSQAATFEKAIWTFLTATGKIGPGTFTVSIGAIP